MMQPGILEARTFNLIQQTVQRVTVTIQHCQNGIISPLIRQPASTTAIPLTTTPTTTATTTPSITSTTIPTTTPTTQSTTPLPETTTNPMNTTAINIIRNGQMFL